MMFQLDTDPERLNTLIREQARRLELDANPSILIPTRSAESSEAQRYLAQHNIKIRVTTEQTNLPPLLVADLGMFLGLHQISEYVRLEENEFNAYAAALRSSFEKGWKRVASPEH